MAGERMRFLFVVFDIHNGGGGERVTANMVNHYLEKGYAVEILSFGKRTETCISALRSHDDFKYGRRNDCHKI